MKPQLILIAGPYRSGTNGDPVRIADNLLRLERAALAVYQRGHVPMIGEWVSLPLARMAGSVEIGDAVSEAFLYPVAHRMIQQCESILRIDGESKGADEDVNAARQLGLPVYYRADDIPTVSAHQRSVE